MSKWWIALGAAALAVSACNSEGFVDNNSREIDRLTTVNIGEAPENEFGFWKAEESSLDPFGADAPDARMIAASTAPQSNTDEPAETAQAEPKPSAKRSQQIAYSYGFGFRIGGDEIAALQKAHTAMCDKMGEACRVISNSQARSESWDAYGELQMQIAADKTDTLAEDLSAPAEELGGTLISSAREGEDLGEQIIDSEARLASRLVLREKLTEVLRSNRGSVDELIAAEKAVAEVNEEIDATRSRLQRYRNRIQYSDVRIEYEPTFGESQIGFVRPVMTAFRSISSTLGMTVAVIVYALTALVPIALLVLALRWVLHRFGLRLRFWKKDSKPSQADA